MFRILGNILWFVFGGLVTGLAWWLAGVIAIVSLVGIPWARSCFVIGTFSLLPFGREVVSRKTYYMREDTGTGVLGMIGNVIWFLFLGFWLALAHLSLAVSLFVTIIGIPFALQHLKLAMIALAPVGKTVVDKEQLYASALWSR